MWVTNRPPRRGIWGWRHHGHMGTAARRDFTFRGYPSREGRLPSAAPPRPAPYRAGMSTPAMEERIMELMPEDAKALGLRFPYEVTRTMDSVEGKRS
jgi:hypothetical protein